MNHRGAASSAGRSSQDGTLVPVVLLSAVGLAGCLAATGRAAPPPIPTAAGAGAGAGTRTSGAPDAPPPDAWRVCAADADCVRLSADCCGCAGGGKGTALAGAWVDAWSAR